MFSRKTLKISFWSNLYGIKEEINFDLKDFKKIHEEFIEGVGLRVFYLGTIDKEIEQLTLSEGDDFRFFTYKETKDLNLNKLHQKVLKMVFN